MQLAKTVALLAACSALALTLPAKRSASASRLENLPNATPGEVIAAVNQLRAAKGLPTYNENAILMGTAQGQADYMASTGTVSHTGPGGITVTARLLQAGYPLAGDLSLGGFRSENIVAGFGMTAAAAVQSWTGDDIHLHTMLSSDLQEIGAGVAEAAGMTYYVIDTARPTGSGVPQAYTPGAESSYSAALNEIIVPVSISTPDVSGNLVHVVQAGQSLWQIAIAYGVKIDGIRALNQLPQSYQIQPGDKLLIARVGTATPAPSDTPSPTSVADTSTPTILAPTDTQVPETPTLAVVSMPAGLSATGIAVGAIILTALIAAGLVSWAGRSRPI